MVQKEAVDSVLQPFVLDKGSGVGNAALVEMVPCIYGTEGGSLLRMERSAASVAVHFVRDTGIVCACRSSTSRVHRRKECVGWVYYHGACFEN